MMDEIEEIINKLDNVTPEEWNKREDETEEEFEERIQEIEEDIEDELIDAISDNLLNEQEINEEEAVKEAREKIDKEYKLYEDAFEKDDNGKLALKDSEELAKLGYESKEEIEKLNTIMNNYNNPDQYIEDIRNSIKAKKDIDAEIERKVEIAKTYISAKIRGEEPVIPSNEEKIKKYEDNNNYITTTRYLKHVPAVQNEYIYTNRIISQNYIPYVPSNRKVVTSGVGTATQIVSRPVVRPKTSVSNPTKVKVLRNLETKMDKSNDLTKQKIQARTELKRVLKEFQDKDLTEDEVTDLQDKIAKIEKKYPNIVNEKTLSKLYKDFNVVIPEKKQDKEVIQEINEEEKSEEPESIIEKIKAEKAKIDSEVENIENNLNNQLEEIKKEEVKVVEPVDIKEDKEEEKVIVVDIKQQEEAKQKQTKKAKRSILGIKGRIEKLIPGDKEKDKTIKVEKAKKEKQEKTKVEKKKPITKPVEKEEKKELIDKAKKELADKKQEVGKIQEDIAKEKQNTESIVEAGKELEKKVEKTEVNVEEVEKETSKVELNTKHKIGLLSSLIGGLKNQRTEIGLKKSKSNDSKRNQNSLPRIFEISGQKDFEMDSVTSDDLEEAVKYLSNNEELIRQNDFKMILDKIEKFTNVDFLNNIDKMDGYFDVGILEKLSQFYKKGIVSKDGLHTIIAKDTAKSNEYLLKEVEYLVHLKNAAENSSNNAIENLKNEIKFSNAIKGMEETSIYKKNMFGMDLMIARERLRRIENIQNRMDFESKITEYKEKIKNSQKLGLYELSILGDTLYEGIKSSNGETIVSSDKMGAKKVYEKLIKDYSETKNEKAYNRLLKLYSDKTQPIYDKNRLEQLRQIMKQKEIKVSNNDKKKKEPSSCVYVCSDLHGEYEVYKAITEEIKENDKLYILGDVIDRGEDGIKILKDVMKRKDKGQVEFFIGNHEYMMLQALNGNDIQKDNWINNNGGKTTLNEFEKLPTKEQDEIKDFLLDSLVYKQVETNGQQFHLVHAKSIQEDTMEKSKKVREMLDRKEDKKIEEAVWSRAGQDYDEKEIARKGVFTIIGHTPTKSERVEYRKGYLNIDCGVSAGRNASLINLSEGKIKYFNVNAVQYKARMNEKNR